MVFTVSRHISPSGPAIDVQKDVPEAVVIRSRRINTVAKHNWDLGYITKVHHPLSNRIMTFDMGEWYFEENSVEAR